MGDAMTFEHQYQFAWDHFKFHADQRTKMFRFFLIVIGLLMTAFSFLAKSDSETAAAYTPYLFLLFYSGGLLATIFLGLDVRNTQLIEHSESILRRIETKWLFPDPEWYEETKRQQDPTKLGLLSRDALLKDYLRENHPKRDFVLIRWLFVDNITHKFAIRSIYLTSISFFWFAAYVVRKPDLLGCWRISVQEWPGWIEIAGILMCLLWSVYALVSPWRDARWERDALAKKLGSGV